jgi:hypothetical protein
MIVFETLFASLYGFLWKARWPGALEWTAMALLVGGVRPAPRPTRTKGTSRPPTWRQLCRQLGIMSAIKTFWSGQGVVDT